MTYSYDLKIKILGFIKSKKFTNIEIINMFQISNKTFYSIKNDPKLRSGSKYSNSDTHKRTTKITIDIRNFIVKYVTTKVNFDYKKLIRIINKKYNTLISKTSVYRILKEEDITKKKICNKQILSDPVKRNKEIEFFKDKVENILINSGMEFIISLDESSMDSHICNNSGWSKRGNKINNVIKHPKIRYTLILAISCKKIIHKKIIKGSANGEIFLEFIKELVKKLRTKHNNYILLDNARIHHYKKVKEFINTKPNIDCIYNIPYTPETNPIERVFNDVKQNLKNKAINNYNFVDEIQKSLRVINKNNKFEEYFNKSLIDELSEL